MTGPEYLDDEHDEPIHPIDGVFTDLFAADMEPPKWIIKDLLPPGLVFVGAPPKAGKSTLEMAIALLVAGFDCKVLPPFLSQVVEPGRVVGFSAEATAGELRHMAEVGLKVKGQPNGALVICDDPFKWRLDDPDGLSNLMFWLQELKPRLVFIDPLRDFHSLEEKDSGQMNRLLRPLQRWAKETDGCVMVIHHTKKKQGDDDRDAGFTPDDLRGTGALFGIADAVLMVTPAREGYVRMHATFKRAQGWQREFMVASYEHAGKQAAEKLGDVERLVVEAVRTGARNDVQIGKLVHAALPRIRDALAVLKRNGLVKRTDKGWKAVPK
jgi:hypothetical protein